MANKNGLILITPTSVDKTGTGSTATINTNGSVTFATCTALSLNGVFTANYDNYMIVMRSLGSDNFRIIYGRLRTSGTNATSTADYNYQYLSVDGTTVSAARSTNEGLWNLGWSSATWRSGLVMNIYGPYLSQPTAFRTVTVDSQTNAYIYDNAGTHELSTSYDGITIYPSANTFTGLVAVYGMRN